MGSLGGTADEGRVGGLQIPDDRSNGLVNDRQGEFLFLSDDGKASTGRKKELPETARINIPG